MNTGVQDSPIQFLRQKIQNIRSALFFSQNNDLIKMPTSIITVLKIDEEGCLWFFVKRPPQCLDAFEKEFPARLDFFRKRTGYFLHVSGKAFIVQDTGIFMDDWNDISPVSKEDLLQEMVLLKVKMMNVDYFDNTPSENKYWWNTVAQKIQQWLYETYLWGKPYDLKPKHFTSRITG